MVFWLIFWLRISNLGKSASTAKPIVSSILMIHSSQVGFLVHRGSREQRDQVVQKDKGFFATISS
jgi:hypothetical protein